MSHARAVLPQPLAIGLGIGALLVAIWAFQDAYEARSSERPAALRLLPV